MFNKWPSWPKWKCFFKVLTKREKIAFCFFSFLVLLSCTLLLTSFYLKNTKVAPKNGGIYIEGVIGQPRFINPIYANSDVDRDLVQLIFSGLMKYGKNFQIETDLANNYTIEEEGKSYTFYLKKNLLWQDKVPITADDVIFTIKTIQNPDFKSPYRANWIGVEIEKIDDLTVKFKLKKAYNAFLENCTIKILPKHIWENVLPESFPFQTQNLEAIGSGPYKIKKIERKKDNQINSLTLIKNPYYFGKPAYISEIEFIFVNDEEELIKQAKQNKINGLGLNSMVELNEEWEDYSFLLPRYFAVFFNQEKSKALSFKEVRLALNYQTNKNDFSPNIVHSPILPEIYGFKPPTKIYDFNPQKAEEILDKADFKDENKDGVREKIIEKKPPFEFQSRLLEGSKGKEVTELQKCLKVETTGFFGSKTKEALIEFQKNNSLSSKTGIVDKETRQKLNEICFGERKEILTLSFSLITVDQPQMIKIAETLKNQWKQLGVEIKIEKYPLIQLEQDFIKPRNYDMLLFGEVLGAIPDPFPFWHSTQKRDPGLNLALYDNKKADDLLEENRSSLSFEDTNEKLSLFQDVLIEDVPVLFLYNPSYFYFVSKEIKGIEKVNKISDPSKRFINIENWYIKTKRVWY